MSKSHIMSLSIDADLHDQLRDQAKKRSISVSEFIRKWLDKYPFEAENVIPVILDIPEQMTNDKAALAEFLAKKSRAIVSVLCG